MTEIDPVSRSLKHLEEGSGHPSMEVGAHPPRIQNQALRPCAGPPNRNMTLQGNDPAPDCNRDRMRAVVGVELRQHTLHVRLYSFFGD
jgi:hypothetical protein